MNDPPNSNTARFEWLHGILEDVCTRAHVDYNTPCWIVRAALAELGRRWEGREDATRKEAAVGRGGADGEMGRDPDGDIVL
jgi:hypothetical protein